MAHINAAQMQLIQQRFNALTGMALPEDGEMSAAFHDAFAGWAAVNMDASTGRQFPAWVEGVPACLATQEELLELADQEPLLDKIEDGDDDDGEGGEAQTVVTTVVVGDADTQATTAELAAIVDQVKGRTVDEMGGEEYPKTDAVAADTANTGDTTADKLQALGLSEDVLGQETTPTANAWFRPAPGKAD